MRDVRDAINDFCLREYGSMGDFGDPTRVPLLYTTVNEEELEDDTDNPYEEYDLQIYLDIVNPRSIICVDIPPYFPGIVEEYTNLHEMVQDLDNTDFNDWYTHALQMYRYRGYCTREED